MLKEIINPWRWQEGYGFVHGNKVSEVKSTLYIAGQTASDTEGNCPCPDDMEAQLTMALENVGTVLAQGGMDFTNVVRLNIYTTDMEKMMAAHGHMVEVLKQKSCQHVGSLLGVSALASPGAMVEIEVTAAN